MTPRRPFRLPLQSGHTPSVDGVLLVGVGLNGTVLAWAQAAVAGPWAVVLAGLLSTVLIAATAYTWDSLLGARPADLWIGPDGLRVEGGRRHGLALPWRAIDPHRCRVENDRSRDTRQAPIRGRQLWVARADGAPDVLLAEVYQVDDLGPLYVVIDELRGAFDLPPLDDGARTVPAQRAPPPPAVRGADVWVCPACGAALTPSEADAVRCVACEEAATVPAAIRERVARHAARTRAQADEGAAMLALLAQPGARRATALQWASFALMAAIAVGGGLLGAGIAGSGAGVLCPFASIAVAVLCAVGVVHALFARVYAARVALRWCLVDLAARRTPGDERPRCRACGGVLPEGEGVVRCAFCDADNLLLEDLRPPVPVARSASVASVLAARDAALAEGRRACVLLAGVALAAALAPFLARDLW